MIWERGVRSVAGMGVGFTVLLATVVACAPPAAGTAPAPAPVPVTTTDTSRLLVPPGYGALRQDDVATQLELPGGVLAKLIPLDETIIRLLSPDSYRTLHDLRASRATEITRLAARHGVRTPNVWYVAFFGLRPEARFSPLEVNLTNSGRDWRPLELIPITSGFGTQRLQPREMQAALYLFDEGIDLTQPITVTIESARVESWSSILRIIERERALVRSRAARSSTTP